MKPPSSTQQPPGFTSGQSQRADMRTDQRLKRTEGHRTRPRPRSTAVAHWARTGTIPEGHAADVAAYRARLTEYHQEEQQEGSRV